MRLLTRCFNKERSPDAMDYLDSQGRNSPEEEDAIEFLDSQGRGVPPGTHTKHIILNHHKPKKCLNKCKNKIKTATKMALLAALAAGGYDAYNNHVNLQEDIHLPYRGPPLNPLAQQYADCYNYNTDIQHEDGWEKCHPELAKLAITCPRDHPNPACAQGKSKNKKRKQSRKSSRRQSKRQSAKQSRKKSAKQSRKQSRKQSGKSRR
jgi:hypothetical protein